MSFSLLSFVVFKNFFQQLKLDNPVSNSPLKMFHLSGNLAQKECPSKCEFALQN
jgi:hypothetical protein